MSPSLPRGRAPDQVQSLIGGPFVRNAWYVAAWADELFEPGRLVARIILGEPVVVFRTSAGTPVALLDRCSHRFAPLSLGKLLPGDRLQCPYHGLEFAPSGACVHNPHSPTISARAAVRSFPLVEKHHALWIWMGDRPADPATVPDFHELDDAPEIASTKRDGMMIRANYQLLVDNLLDLSHTCYLHAGVLGNADTVNAEITVDQEGDDVLVGRFSPNSSPPGILAPFWPGHPPKVDVFNRVRWMAPSALKLVSGLTAPGEPWESGTGLHAIHMLTPETESTTHYFFTAVRWNLRTTDEEVNRAMQAKIAELRRYAFEAEDAPVVEAQQRRIALASGPIEPMILPIDAGPMRYKRVLARMIEAES